MLCNLVIACSIPGDHKSLNHLCQPAKSGDMVIDVQEPTLSHSIFSIAYINSQQIREPFSEDNTLVPHKS